MTKMARAPSSDGINLGTHRASLKNILSTFVNIEGCFFLSKEQKIFAACFRGQLRSVKSHGAFPLIVEFQRLLWCLHR